jgi:hypothetical protein
VQANRAKPTPTCSKTASKSSVPPIMSAKRSIYFADPDGNGLENLLRDAAGAGFAPERARRRRRSSAIEQRGRPLPQWLVEEWPGPAAMAKVERPRRQPAAQAAD